MIRRVFLFAVCCLFALPSFAQKLTKEEKEAKQKALYEAAVEAVEEKDFAIVPSAYIDDDGVEQALVDNTIFIAYERTQMFMQGSRVCGNSYTNVADVLEYTPSYDKKGNLKLKIKVQGRMIQGTYTISMRSNGNEAEVIFTPGGNGVIRKFKGPLLSTRAANYMKRANAM